MSIASELTRLQNAKAAIKQSLENKGATIDSSATLSDYPSIIDNLPSGGDTLTFVVDNPNLTFDISTGESTQTSYHIYYNETDVTNNSTIYSINKCIDSNPNAGTLTPFKNGQGVGKLTDTLFASYNELAAYVEINVEYYESVQPVQVILSGYEPSYTIPYDTQNYFYMLPQIEITATLDNGEEPTNPQWSSDLGDNLRPDGNTCSFIGMLMDETAGTRQITVTFTCDQGSATEGFELVVQEMPSLQITATSSVNQETGEYTITATSNYGDCKWSCSGLSNITETGNSYSSTYTVSGKLTQADIYIATITCTNEIGTQATTTVKLILEAKYPLSGYNDSSVSFNWDFAKSAYVYSGQGFTNTQLHIHNDAPSTQSYYLIPKFHFDDSTDTTTLKFGEKIELVEANDNTELPDGLSVGFLNDKGIYFGFNVPSDLGTAYIKKDGNQWFVYGYNPDYVAGTFTTSTDNKTVYINKYGIKNIWIDGVQKTVADSYVIANSGSHRLEAQVNNGYAIFSQDDNLETAILPDWITEIGNGSFYNTKKLRYLELPKNLQKISGDFVYYLPSGCVLKYNSDVPTITNNRIYYPKVGGKIVVPSQYLDNFKTLYKQALATSASRWDNVIVSGSSGLTVNFIDRLTLNYNTDTSKYSGTYTPEIRYNLELVPNTATITPSTGWTYTDGSFIVELSDKTTTSLPLSITYNGETSETKTVYFNYPKSLEVTTESDTINMSYSKWESYGVFNITSATIGTANIDCNSITASNVDETSDWYVYKAEGCSAEYKYDGQTDERPTSAEIKFTTTYEGEEYSTTKKFTLNWTK